MQLGPALGTGSFWAPLSYNLGRSHDDVGSVEHVHHIDLGRGIGYGCVCPSRGFFLQLNRAEKEEGGRHGENDDDDG